jgi:hypothetical protein
LLVRESTREKNMRLNIVATFVVTAALAFAGQRAGACGTHMSVTNSGATDTNCLFNVGDSGYTLDVSIDQALTDTGESESGMVSGILSTIPGSVPGSPETVNFNNGESDITFTVPAGTDEITVTLTDANGNAVSETEVLAGGSVQSVATPAGCGGAGPVGPKLNTAVPGPGLSPADLPAAVDDLQGADISGGDKLGAGESGSHLIIK